MKTSRSLTLALLAVLSGITSAVLFAVPASASPHDPHPTQVVHGRPGGISWTT
ncbi:hypothetical protein [Streptosporangium sp. NPDC051022]|uniref:hypothetical protein n=1 Tax=Streptosporangium sp. NPDC051022 TaxID=3155752 RepID=UPI003421D2ED